MCCFFCFFFQAEDGIRGFHVTGVQTCALPIFGPVDAVNHRPDLARDRRRVGAVTAAPRSEERRVGKECRSRWSPDQLKKNKRESARAGGGALGGRLIESLPCGSSWS